MSQVEKPKVFLSGYDYGFGTSVDALPACKYWARQNWPTEEMVAEREQALQEQKPDFIMQQWWPEIAHTYDELNAKYVSLGYVQYSKICLKDTFALYGRPGLQLPPDDFYVSQWDVWLKRNIFGI